MIAFWVEGVPVQQGSKIPGIAKRKAGPKAGQPYAFMRESSDRKLRPWRMDIVTAARHAMAGRPKFVGPVGLSIDFHFPPLKSDPLRYWRYTAPDLSKLIRAVEDALTDAEVWEDDARVCEYGRMRKLHSDTPGASIRVWQLTTAEPHNNDNIIHL